MRHTGIPSIGDVPWGTHFCQFYETRQDLVDILVPYFTAGLQSNEFCMWVTSEPLSADDAAAALRREFPGLNEYAAKGQIEILDYRDWYTPGGRFDSERVLRGWIEKLEAARARGFDGLRLTGNTFWLETSDWRDFTDYEAAVDATLGRYPMLAMCTYSLAKCGAPEIMDVISNHAFALIKRGGRWQIIESAERRRIEVSLRESEERLRALNAGLEARVRAQTGEIRAAYELLGGVMAGTTDKIAALDTGFRYVACNQAYRDEFRDIFGVPVAPGDSMVDALAHLPEEQTNAVALWGRALRGETFTLEHDFGDVHLRRGAYEIHFFPIRDQQGRITGAAHIARDVTARRLAEEAVWEANQQLERRVAERTAALAESEERLRVAAAAAGIGVWSWTPDTGAVAVGGEWRRLFGIADDAPVNVETWRKALHPEDRGRTLAELQAALAERREFNGEYRVLHPDGTVRWLVDRGRAAIDERSGAVRMSGVNVDITARKQSEEALRRQQEWLRVTLTSIGDAVLATDTAGRITFLNPVAAELTGWSCEEALGRPVQEVMRVVNEATHQSEDDVAGRALREGRAVAMANHSCLLTRDSREVPIEDSAAPIRDHAGNVTGAVVVFHDVTDKRRAQQELCESEQRVRHKLDSILSPEGDVGALDLRDIIDTGAIQRILEDAYELSGVPMSILDLEGNVLAGAGWQDICTRFHRVHPTSCEACRESDTRLSAGVPPGEFRLYKCKNQMWDVATPLMIGGRHMGNLFSGQFFFDDETPDYDCFLSQSERYGFEPGAYIAALDRVPRLSRRAVEAGMAFLMKLGHMISLLSYSNLKLARSLAERDTLTASLRESTQRLERSQAIAHLGSWELDLADNRLSWTDEVYRIFGFEPQEFGATYEAFLAAVHPDDRAAVDAAYSSSLSGGRDDYEIDHRVIRRTTGEVRWVHEKCTHFRDAAGAVVRSIGMVQDITERKRAAEALRESEERFRLMADSAPLMIWVNGPDGCEFVNRGYVEFIGVPPEQLLGMRWASALHPDDADAYLAAYRRAFRGSARFEAQVRIRRADGVYRWFKSAGVPRLSASGELLGYAGCSVDITDVKDAEEALRRSEELLRAVCDNTADCVFLKDTESRLILANPAALRVIGKPAGEVIGKRDSEFYADAETGRTILENDRRILSAGHTQVLEETVRGPGGDRVFLSSKTPWRDAQGRIIGLVGVARDITERRRAEEALKRSEALYRGIARSLPDGCVYLVDRELTFLVAEGSLLAALGQDRHSLEGAAVDCAFDPKALPVLRDRYRRALAGESAGFEDEYAGRTIWSRYVPLLDDNGQIVGAMALWLDVTEPKRIEAQLRQAQKLESIGLLAGGIAHDFNNLLVGVIGNASLAEDMLPPGNPAAEVIRRIVKAGEQAAHLTRQMLAYAGKGRIVVEPVDLSALVREGASLVQSSVSKKIAFSLHLQPCISTVESDLGQMQQVFYNLALNAAEAIGSGPGAVAIATGETTVDAAYICANLNGWPIEPGKFVFLEVRDTGCGMDQPTAARIFDPFFSTKFQGRGLGLAAVAGIVRTHKGAIQVITAPGAGSTFRVLLPAMAAGATGCAAAAPAVDDLEGRQTVLVVDDEDVVRNVASHALSRHGYTVLTAGGGEAAIETLRRSAGCIDLVVLDLSMPVMSGEETLPHLWQLKPGLKVIVSSGYSEAEALRLFQGAKVAGFIQKPYTPRDLARKVKSVLSAKAAASP